MEDKLAKLEIATKQSEEEMNQYKQSLDEITAKVNETKQQIRETYTPEEQEKIMINDTELPELLEQLAFAKEAYETSSKRYETNKRYVALIQEKIQATASAATSK